MKYSVNINRNSVDIYVVYVVEYELCYKEVAGLFFIKILDFVKPFTFFALKFDYYS